MFLQGTNVLGLFCPGTCKLHIHRRKGREAAKVFHAKQDPRVLSLGSSESSACESRCKDFEAVKFRDLCIHKTRLKGSTA